MGSMGAAYKLRLHRGGATTATHAGLTPRRLRAVVATATFTILCVCAAPARGAVVKTLHLEGDVPPTGFDFFTVPFQVPTGIQEVRVHHQHIGDSSNILDWGLQDARGNAGFRGWGGELPSNAAPHPRHVGLTRTHAVRVPFRRQPGACDRGR